MSFIEKAFCSTPGSYSLTIFKNHLNVVLQIFLYLESVEGYTPYDWLKCGFLPIRSCIDFKFTKFWGEWLVIMDTEDYSQPL